MSANASVSAAEASVQTSLPPTLPAKPGSAIRAWVGAKVSDLEAAAKTRVAYISRMGEAIVPTGQTVIQDGDVVHVMARSNDMERINDALATRVEGAE